MKETEILEKVARFEKFVEEAVLSFRQEAEKLLSDLGEPMQPEPEENPPSGTREPLQPEPEEPEELEELELEREPMLPEPEPDLMLRKAVEYLATSEDIPTSHLVVVSPVPGGRTVYLCVLWDSEGMPYVGHSYNLTERSGKGVEGKGDRNSGGRFARVDAFGKLLQSVGTQLEAAKVGV